MSNALNIRSLVLAALVAAVPTSSFAHRHSETMGLVGSAAGMLKACFQGSATPTVGEQLEVVRTSLRSRSPKAPSLPVARHVGHVRVTAIEGKCASIELVDGSVRAKDRVLGVNR